MRRPLGPCRHASPDVAWAASVKLPSGETITALPPLRLPKKRSGIVGTPLKMSELFGCSPTPVNEPQCPCHERHAAAGARPSASDKLGNAAAG